MAGYPITQDDYNHLVQRFGVENIQLVLDDGSFVVIGGEA